MSTATAFDPVAARYDQVWTESPAGRAQRDLVWREWDRVFGPGDRILDIGCGTGVDAAHYMSRGVIVGVVDASLEMIRIAQARGGFSARVLRAEELAGLEGPTLGAQLPGRTRWSVGQLGAVDPTRRRPGHRHAGTILRVGVLVLLGSR
jgi:SAM-dependent methyltransferase